MKELSDGQIEEIISFLKKDRAKYIIHLQGYTEEGDCVKGNDTVRYILDNSM